MYEDMIRVVVFQRMALGTEFTMEFHSHLATEILYVSKGIAELIYFADGCEQTARLHKGNYVIVFPWTRHKVRQALPKTEILELELSVKDNKTALPLYLKKTAAAALLKKVLTAYENGKKAVFLKDDDTYYTTANSFISFLAKTDDFTEPLNYFKYRVFLERLAIAAAENASMRPAKAANIHVNKAISVMTAEYSARLTLADISERVGITAPHLENLFKQALGKTTMEYLTELRLEAALHYLSETGYTYAQIAILCGFGNYRNFYNTFKNKQGMTPSEFRHSPKSVYEIPFNYLAPENLNAAIPLPAKR